MKINSFKDLEKLVKLCRKTGVHTIKADGVELTMGAEPKKPSQPIEIPQDPLANVAVPMPNIRDEGPDTIINHDELTEEQRLFYSARPEDFESQQQ